MLFLPSNLVSSGLALEELKFTTYLCLCGAQETVFQVLVDCIRLQELWRELWRETGGVFNSVLSLLGGCREG